MAQRYCSKCNKTMSDINFYTYKNGEKCELCKNCLTMHINTYDPDSYMQLMEKFDVPYVDAEQKTQRGKEYEKAYNKVLMGGKADSNAAREAAYNMTKGNSVVFGKYLSKMKLKQFKDYGWADTEKLKAEAETRAREAGKVPEEMEAKIAEMKEKFLAGEISEAQYMTYADYEVAEAPPTLEDQFLQDAKEGKVKVGGPVNLYNEYPENNHPFEEVELVDVGAELTQEDKVYLATKQGQFYKAADWVKLEKLYKDFMDSFDIQGAARIDTLQKICKTSLKMDQAIDSGDVDSYQKLSRVYDALMKAGKFTEAQRKEEKTGEFDSVGQIVYFAEKEGGKIPRHVIDTPLDIVDEAIDNLKKYTHDLIVNDPSLSQMLEMFIKRRENAQQHKKDLEEAKAKGLENIEINTEDYEELNDFLEEEKSLDDTIKLAIPKGEEDDE